MFNARDLESTRHGGPHEVPRPARTATLRRALLVLGLALCSAATQAQVGYPQRPVTLVVPFGAGSVVDVQARVLARGLAQRLGQAVVVDNKPGVAGSLGSEAVARAAPDGYTLLVGTQGSHGTNVALYKTVRYDPVKDFVAVHGLLANTPVLICSPQRKLGNMAALVEQARQQPGKLSFGSGGAGTAGHLLLELMQSSTGARFTHIPYKSGTAAQVDLIAGRIDCMFDYVASSGTHLRSGALQALAVTGRKRLPALPEVPTTAEAGFPTVEATSWGGLFAPAGTPPAIVKRLSDEMDAVMKSDEVKALLDTTSSVPLDLPQQPFSEFVAREAARWGELIRKAGITLE